MVTVREKFHELGNWHNKISMAAITARESLQEAAKLFPSGQKESIEKAIKILDRIEGYVKSADQTVGSIKPFVYAKIGGDVKVHFSEKSKGGSET